MKKEYIKPHVEAVEIRVGQQLLQASKVNNNADIDEIITGGNEPGRAPGLFDDPAWNVLLGQ